MLKKLALAGALAIAFCASALAQSNPGLTYGQVPTAAQWNSYFAAKQDAINDSRVLWGPQSGVNGISGGQYGTATYPGGPYATNTLTLGPTSSIWNGSQLTLSGSPYGWGNSATVLCIQTFATSLSPCGVAGGVASPNGYATYGGRDIDTFVPTIWGPGPRIYQTPAQVIPPQAGTFTATSFVPTTPLTGGQVALLAFRQQVKSSDGCTATLYNWATNGTALYTSAWQCGSSFVAPSGVSAEVDNDPAALSGTWVSATKFKFTTPLTSGQIANLRAGLALDTNDNPVCSASLTDWDTVGGTYVNASLGFFSQSGGGSCTPSGTQLIIGDMIKLFATNPATYLYGSSRAYQMANEFDCNNNQTPWVSGGGLALSNVGYNMWCQNVASYGKYQIGYGIIINSNSAAQNPNNQKGFFTGIEIESGMQEAAIEVNPTAQNVNIAYSTKGYDSGNATVTTAFQDWSSSTGNIWAKLPSHSGVWSLGNQGSTASSPGINLFSSGANTGTADSSILGSGGTGSAGSGTITVSGNVVTKPGSDSTGAFQAKTAGGATELGVDTQNHVVTLSGGATNGVKVFGSSGTPIIIPRCGGSNCSILLESAGTGSVMLQPQTNSTSAIKFVDADGVTALLTGDTSNNVLTIGGNIYTSGTTPTVGTCGTSPAISGTDVSGKLTVGTGTTTSCTVSFHATLPNAPHGVVLTPANATAAAQGTTLAYVSSISTSQWVITATNAGGAVYYYHVE